jgi:hypothetical protein
MNREVRARVAPRSRIARLVKGAVTGAAATAALGWFSPISASAANSPYFAAPFTFAPIAGLAHSFGQGPSFTPSGNVLSAQLDSAGISQIYVSPANNDSSGAETCLTCTTITGPNALPQERPQADWILFESYGQQQAAHLGNPGFGGFGGDLYVMHPDGSDVNRLTTNSDPNLGVPYTTVTGTPYDNFHAYWSPNGKHVAWVHLEADGLPGGEKWELMVGDFTVNFLGVPSLNNVRVVGQPFGAYEMQPWAPDGSGFIFFASGGHASPFQATAPGWGNSRIYFMRVFSEPTDAPLATPTVTPLTDNLPYYTEQALFTPDMQAVIMMSNRAQSATSWTREVMNDSQVFAFDTDQINTGATQTLQFVTDFNGVTIPADDFQSDLYIVDSSNVSNVRRLTSLGQVVPEFYWNANYTQLISTVENVNGTSASYTGSFSGSLPHTPPSTTPAWLAGTAPVWTRVGAALLTPTQTGSVNNLSVPVVAPSSPAPAFPHNATNNDVPLQATPLVALSYGVPWQTDLTTLGNMSGHTDLASRGLDRVGGL